MNESDANSRPGEMPYRAPRYTANLKASVLISAVSNTDETAAPYLSLQGRLLNVSLSGLAIIVSFEDVIEMEALGADITLNLLLPLPVQAIEVNAVPVRYRKTGEDEKSDVLIGAQITNMNGRDRILFMEFIRGFETGNR